MSDEAVRVGPAVASESYLDMNAIFSAIEQTGAKAVRCLVNVHVSDVFVFEGDVLEEEKIAVLLWKSVFSRANTCQNLFREN